LRGRAHALDWAVAALLGGSWGALDGGSTLEVTLSWRALDVPTADYAVTLGIVDAEGRVRVQRQDRHPVGGTHPTSRWQPGQVVADSYRLDPLVALPSDHYHLWQ
jgi:hypothetical protein